MPAHVIVVGGGLAGLAAAWRLQSAGARATLLEARARVGGALAPDDTGGQGVPAVVPRRTPHLVALAHELDADPPPRRELHAARVLTPGRVATRELRMRGAIRWLRGPRLRRLQSIQAWLGARLDPACPDGETRLDDRSVADLARVYLGRPALDGLLAPLLEAAWGLDARETSRQLLLPLLSGAGDPELDALLDLDLLAERLAAGLRDVRTGERVTSVLGGGRGVRLEGGAQLDADATVIACAAREVPALSADLTHVERELLETWPTIEGAVLRLELRDGASDAPAGAPGWTWTPGSRELAGAIDAAPDGASRGRRALWLRARPAWVAHGPASEDALTDAMLRAAGRLWPGLPERVASRRLVRTRAAMQRVGAFRAAARLLAEARRRPERHIALCGDYLCGPHAEALVASGERAAREVLARSHAP